jgi:thioesterase domain-containing protein/acyl carrier protein
MDIEPARSVDSVLALAEREDAGDISTVTHLFAKVLDVESVEPDDDFFRLGGDSLIAAALTVAIERECGIRLSISALLEAPTPRTLAYAILEASSASRIGSALIAARPTGDGTPLFCVHGQRGESIFPRKLARTLKDHRPIYGFRALGLETNERPLSSVPAMASYYLAAAKQLQPEGPYLFLGHCGGSLVAYEMAQQLSATGEEVAGLIQIDPPQHGKLSPFLHKSGMELEMEHMLWSRRVENTEAAFDANPNMTVAKRREAVGTLMNAAVARYVPTPYGGRTLFMFSTPRKTTLLRGYSPLLSACEFVEIESNHFKLFADHVDELALRIDSFIDRVCPKS